MILSAAETALKRYGFDDTDPLTAWLDQGKNDVESVYNWPFLQSFVPINGTPNSSSLILPADFFKIQSLRDLTNRYKLKYMEIDGFEERIDDPTQAGNPEVFTAIADSTIQLWPVPATLVTYRCVYQKALADITALLPTDTLPGPARLHYLYVLIAAAYGLQAENEEERSKNAFDLSNTALQRLIRKYGATLGTSATVQNVQGY